MINKHRFDMFGPFLACLLVTTVVCPVESAAPDNQTLSNLNGALRGETNASHRYELFATKAAEEGYQQVARLFRAVSMSESVHRNNHKAAILEMGGTPDFIEFAKVNVKTTRQNLEGPVKGEAFEKDVMYPHFIRQAQKDKATIAINSFEYAQRAEAQHDLLFEKALKELGQNTVTDYCVSPITGATVEVPLNQSCPKESTHSMPYIHIR